MRLFVEDGPTKSYPVSPGYEYVGEVVELGSDAEGLAKGDLVWIDRPHSTEHIVRYQEAVAGKLPPGMSPENGVFFALARVALGAVHDAAIKVGDHVAVIGVGTVGLLVAQMALMNGAEKVIAVDRVDVRLGVAADLGAIPIHIDAHADAAAAVKNLLEGGVDVAIETSGNPAGLQTAIRACALGGKVVTASSYTDAADQVYLGREYQRNRVEIISSMTVNDCPHRSFPLWDIGRLNLTARTLLENGRLNVKDLITHRIPFEEATTAYGMILDEPHKTIKVVLTYEDCHT